MLHPKTQQLKLQLKIVPESRVFGYVRVSTYYQKEYRTSLEAQKDRILKHCKEHNLTLQYLYEDAAKSGKDIKNKPAMQALLANIKAGDTYIFTSISRLGRKTFDNIYIFDILHKNNCKIVILDLSIDITTAAGKVTFQMFSVVSEAERDLISQRTKEVMKFMKQKGVLRTKPPFGQQITMINDKKTIIENPKEQKVISFIKQLVEQYPKIKLTTIMKALKENNMTLRNGKLYHEGIRSILINEKIREQPKKTQ